MELSGRTMSKSVQAECPVSATRLGQSRKVGRGLEKREHAGRCGLSRVWGTWILFPSGRERSKQER